MYLFLLALIYIAFISLGLPDSLLGSGWPDRATQSLACRCRIWGFISMIISGGTVVSSLFSDKMTRRFGTRIVTVASVFLTVIALFGFSFSSQFWMLAVFAVPYGLGAGAIDSALNNYVALHYKAKHMSWLHCFWGVGAVASPFVMGYALTNADMEQRLSRHRIFAAGHCPSFTCDAAGLEYQQIGNGNRWKECRTGGCTENKGRSLSAAWFFCVLCTGGDSNAVGEHLLAYEVKGISTERAATFAALFYIGITSGRFASGFITDKLGDQKMIRLGTGILICGILVLFLPIASYQAAFAAFLVIGFGCAPIYPCIIHSTPSNFGAENSGAIIGIQMASAYIGTTFIPPIFGILGNSIGFFILPLYLLVFVALMITMVEVTFRITKNRNSL